MTAKKLVSVIVPWRNTPLGLLQRALDSVLFQSLDLDIEVIIVNDDSDPSLQEQLSHKVAQLGTTRRSVHIYSLKAHSGIAAARNHGLERAQGDLVSWLDADDEFDLNALEALCNRMDATAADFVVGDCLIVLPHGRHERRLSGPYLGRLHTDFAGTLFDPWMTTVFAVHPQLLKSSVARAVGLFDPHYLWAEMTDFVLRVLSELDERAIEHVPAALYRYRRMDRSSHSSERDKLDSYRRTALRAQARRAGCDVDDFVYLGRETSTGAQHYAPVVDKRTLLPPYLMIDRKATRSDVVLNPSYLEPHGITKPDGRSYLSGPLNQSPR